MRVAPMRTTMALALVLCGSMTDLAAQQVYAYPKAGQSEQQQSQDRFECHQWSVSQSGFDPSTAPPLSARPTPPPPPRGGYSDQRQRSGNRGMLGIGDGGFFEGGGMMGDAATGAALGAAGGAIAGNAGQGAAIGAVASTLFGAMSRSTQRPDPAPQGQYESDYYYRERLAQSDHEYQQRAAQVAEYNRAFGACMQSRDYSVN